MLGQSRSVWHGATRRAQSRPAAGQRRTRGLTRNRIASRASAVCPASFGACGQITLQPKDPRRIHEEGSNKQTADWCVGGPLLGVTAGRKCIMLLKDGRTTVTSDVHFLPDASVPDRDDARIADEPSRCDSFSTEPDTGATVGDPAPSASGMNTGNTTGDSAPSAAGPHFTGIDGSALSSGRVWP